MKTNLATIVCKFGDDPSIWLGEGVILTDQTDGQMDAAPRYIAHSEE